MLLEHIFLWNLGNKLVLVYGTDLKSKEPTVKAYVLAPNMETNHTYNNSLIIDPILRHRRSDRYEGFSYRMLRNLEISSRKLYWLFNPWGNFTQHHLRLNWRHHMRVDWKFHKTPMHTDHSTGIGLSKTIAHLSETQIAFDWISASDLNWTWLYVEWIGDGRRRCQETK